MCGEQEGLGWGIGVDGSELSSGYERDLQSLLIPFLYDHTGYGVWLGGWIENYIVIEIRPMYQKHLQRPGPPSESRIVICSCIFFLTSISSSSIT